MKSIASSTYLGGSGSESANDVAVAPGAASTTDAFIVGTTTSSNFTDHQNTLNFHDAFVLRLSATGTTALYSRFLGGSDLEEGQAIAVDINDNAYVTGWTLSSTGFNPINAAQPSYGGAYDAFITKLGPSGVPIYNSYFGGSGQELGYGIALLDDSAYITGHTKSLVLPGTAGRFQQACATGSLGCNDAFVTRYSSTGTLQFSTYLGGNSFEYGQDIAVDADGSAYVIGYTDSGNFPTAFALQSSFQGLNHDAFVSAINSTGTSLLYGTYLGGSSTDKGYGIAVDTNGSIYVTGSTASSNFPAFDNDFPYAGGEDAFIAKMSGTLGFEFSRPTAGAAGGNATADKPQSKLWWNDGYWWAVLYDWSYSKQSIYRLTWPNEWVWTGTAVDARYYAHDDALWDNVAKKLYIVSVPSRQPNETLPPGANTESRLYRYSYNSTTKAYALDAGFPSIIMSGQAETMTIAKDTTGKLWVAYTNANQAKYQVSTDDGINWGVQNVIPNAPDVDVSYDDIAAIIAFDGKIGVLWSDHDPEPVNRLGDPNATYRFAYRNDSSPIGTWQPTTTVALPPGNCASDDHINMKADANGRLYIAAKTSFADTDWGCPGGSPNVQLMLLVRQTNGTWTWTSFATIADGLTRPSILIDSTNNKLYMFASPEPGGIVYMKSTDLNNPSFANQPGKGQPFISGITPLNNATTTKQAVNGSTNLVVVATDQYVNHFYMHNVIDLPGQAPPSGAAYTFGPTADTYVSQASPTSNYATSSSFSIVGGASSAKQAFLRFTVSGLPASAVVQNARLRLYVTNDSTSSRNP